MSRTCWQSLWRSVRTSSSHSTPRSRSTRKRCSSSVAHSPNQRSSSSACSPDPHHGHRSRSHHGSHHCCCHCSHCPPRCIAQRSSAGNQGGTAPGTSCYTQCSSRTRRQRSTRPSPGGLCPAHPSARSAASGSQSRSRRQSQSSAHRSPRAWDYPSSFDSGHRAGARLAGDRSRRQQARHVATLRGTRRAYLLIRRASHHVGSACG